MKWAGFTVLYSIEPNIYRKKQKPQGNLLRGEIFRGKRASQLCLSGTKGRIRRYFSQVGKSTVFPV